MTSNKKTTQTKPSKTRLLEFCIHPAIQMPFKGHQWRSAASIPGISVRAGLKQVRGARSQFRDIPGSTRSNWCHRMPSPARSHYRENPTVLCKETQRVFSLRASQLFCTNCAKESFQRHPSSWLNARLLAISLSSLLSLQIAGLSMHCAKAWRRRGRMFHAAYAACGRHPKGPRLIQDSIPGWLSFQCAPGSTCCCTGQG